MKPGVLASGSAPLPGRVGAAKQAYDWVRELWSNYESRTSWVISVESTDRIYDAVQGWVLQLAERSGKLPRALLAKTARNDMLEAVDPNGPYKPSGLEVSYHADSQSGTRVVVSGHSVEVSLQRGSVRDDRLSDQGNNYLTDRLQFRCRTLAARRVVQAELARLANAESAQRPKLHLGQSYGGWYTRNDLPMRPLDSVILPKGQKETLVDDLQRFLASEAEYARRGIPYHRGVLLSGPPGAGKSSLVEAVSSHLGLDLFFISLGDFRRDGNLIEQVSHVNPRSALLLEDVDVFHAARERDDDGEGATLAGLLNSLDGVVTPHGLITFLTTNEVEVLDKALVRPGRVDLHLELKAPTWEQIADLWGWFYSTDPALFRSWMSDPSQHRRPLSMAEATEAFKRFPDDPRRGQAALYRRLDCA